MRDEEQGGGEVKRILYSSSLSCFRYAPFFLCFFLFFCLSVSLGVGETRRMKEGKWMDGRTMRCITAVSCSSALSFNTGLGLFLFCSLITVRRMHCVGLGAHGGFVERLKSGFSFWSHDSDGLPDLAGNN
ncbi:hypothetical protein B0T22DRAFT_227895 [Podospora appendiculata]|uniref:Transmembrane protein n=1 Tax=Podospora appendiculata TaxID=314037 RepID=A0AAE1CAQ2_9PEZI|nr:hypothetical protein B0T22DRAFT_227895 [Podospora appendiculata]